MITPQALLEHRKTSQIQEQTAFWLDTTKKMEIYV